MVVGALGTISYNLKFYLKKKIGIAIIASYFQKIVIIETAFILRRVPGNSEVR